jgi:tetratricopeptide (TPR) repeat protein
MKRWIWMALAAIVVVGAGVTLVAVPSQQEWTTSSPEALAEFELAMQAEQKLYYPDAHRHLTRAIELDPDFAIAKLWSLAPMYQYDQDKENTSALFDEIVEIDTSGMTPREQFFFERAKLNRAEKREEIPGLLDEYVANYPNDPYLLNEKAVRHWERNEFDQAEDLYQQLVSIAPNRVVAYNQLGYIYMSKGRFAEAEEQFKNYRFIAHDQANPHDSLGELFITLGRNDEAEATFEKALEIKPDFWESYNHIALLKSFNNDIEGAREILDRAHAAGIPDGWVADTECLVQFKGLRDTGSWEEILELAKISSCVEESKLNYAKTITHLAACETGKWDLAVEIEGAVQEQWADLNSKGIDIGARSEALIQAAIEHLQGVRLALQGNYDEAEKLLRAADERITYIEAGSAIFKLENRMILVELLLATGKDADAHQLLADVKGVNPLWVDEFQDSGFRMLGLERG